MPARLHRANVVSDVLGGARMINQALAKFRTEGRGVLVYLRDGAAGVPVQTDTPPSSDDARKRQWREIGLGAQILRDLGIVSIRNLVTKPQSYVALSGFGIEIADTEILD
jgi:3,4-dihydroxy 2-butanone 4-phosphate synthase/GTP cyclohydrolase II